MGMTAAAAATSNELHQQEDAAFWSRFMGQRHLHDTSNLSFGGVPSTSCSVALDLDCQVVETGQPCTSLQLLLPSNNNNPEDCIRTLRFTMTVQNTAAASSLDITQLSVAVNAEQQFSLAPNLASTLVPAGSAIPVMTQFPVQLCTNESSNRYVVRVIVEADPGNCRDVAEYVVTVDAASTSGTLPPRLDCITDVSIVQCRLASNGQDCSTLEPRAGINCEETIYLDTELCNVGPVPMQVNAAELAFGVDAVEQYVSRVQPNPLPVGSCYRETFLRLINACETASIPVQIRAQANPPNGNSCSSEDFLSLNTMGVPPTPRPTPRPTPLPTPRPSPRPTPGPTPRPSPRPTQPLTCLTQVEIRCTLAGGADCASLAVAAPSDCTAPLPIYFNTQVCNTGAVPIQINFAQFAFGASASTADYLARINPNPLPPGQCYQETFQIDLDETVLCTDATYQAGVRVDATPAGGTANCPDEAFTSVTTVGPPPTLAPTTPLDCQVDATLGCVAAGAPCVTSLVAPPTAVCDVGVPLDAVTFTYHGRACNPGLGNGQDLACFDQAPILFTDPVTVQCQDGTMTGVLLRVEPPVVQPGGLVVVASADGVSALPDLMQCAIFDVADGTQLQSMEMDTSGLVRLDLGDEFGALRLDGCERGGEELSCVESLAYQVEITNVGPVDMSVTMVEFTFNGQTFNLMSEVRQNPLVPGQSTALAPSLQLNICDVNNLLASISVQADPPNGGSCQDLEEYQ